MSTINENPMQEDGATGGARDAKAPTLLVFNDFTYVRSLSIADDVSVADRARLKLEEAWVVEYEDAPADLLTLDSVFLYRLDGGPLQRRALVQPQKAHPNGQFISLATPLGLALLGRRSGETIDVKLPGGTTCSVELIGIEFQPEAELQRRMPALLSSTVRGDVQ